MCAVFIQNVLVWALSCRVILQAQAFMTKRSPLEFGYVTFPNQIGRHKGLLNRTNTELEAEKSSVDLSLPITTDKVSHTHEWIPGHIRHHSFIPAHVHHIYLPILITRTVIVKQPENFYGLYPKHFGGYGVGAYSGGQGAGHGFQILFNP